MLVIDWFLVFNATFSNISAISWWTTLVQWPLIWVRITQKSDWKGFKLSIHSMWLVSKGDPKVKFELHVYMKFIEFYFVVVLSPTLHIDHPNKNQSMMIIPGTNTSQAIVNIPSSTSGNKTVCVDVIEAQNGYVIIILNKYSGTCAMRHLGFPTSSDIQ